MSRQLGWGIGPGLDPAGFDRWLTTPRGDIPGWQEPEAEITDELLARCGRRHNLSVDLPWVPWPAWGWLLAEENE